MTIQLRQATWKDEYIKKGSFDSISANGYHRSTIVDQVDANFKTHLQFCLRLALCASVQNWDSLKFFVQILKASTQGVWTAIKLFTPSFSISTQIS
jgi:hypothetical protein